MPEATKALELSLREAIRFGHRSIGPEHLLLGLRLDPSRKLLEDHDVHLERLGREIVDSFGDTSGDPGQRAA
jgi:hypothetical protein